MSDDLLPQEVSGEAIKSPLVATLLMAVSRIEQWQRSTDGRLKDMSDKLVSRESFDDLKSKVSALASRESVDDLRRRIGLIESSQTWVVRTIIGAVLLAVLGGALAIAKSHGATLH